MPIVLKNRLSEDIKKNPRNLAAVLQELKPQAKFKDVRVMPSGDIKVTGVEPHDYSILRQEWPDTHGKITPVLPQEKSINEENLFFRS